MTVKTCVRAVGCLVLTAFASSGLWAQVVTEAEKLDPNASAELKAFKAKVQAANPGMEVVAVEADVVKRAVLAPLPQPVNPKIAIFVKNRRAWPAWTTRWTAYATAFLPNWPGPA